MAIDLPKIFLDCGKIRINCFDNYLLKIKEIKKKRVEERIIKGPAGSPVSLKSKLPKRQLKMPKNCASQRIFF